MNRIIYWGCYPPITGVDPYLFLDDDGTWYRDSPCLPKMEVPDLIVVGDNHLLLGRCIIPYNCVTKGVLEVLRENMIAWSEDPRFGGDKAWLEGFIDAFQERLEGWQKMQDL